MTRQLGNKFKATVLKNLVKIRIDDAWALLKTGDAARRIGALYLAGYAVECALKARICSDTNAKYLAPKFFIHDLQKLGEFTTLRGKLSADKNVNKLLAFLALSWSVNWRYQQPVLREEEVKLFLERVTEFQTWLFEN